METHLEPYIRHLQALPFVKDVTLSQISPTFRDGLNLYEVDALLNIKTPQGSYEFFVEEKKTNLTYALADGLAARIQRMSQKPWILFAIHVPRRIGRYLGEQGVNYVDRAGNCRVQIGTNYMAVIEGQTPVQDSASGRGIGVPGHRVLFSILAKPDTLNSPVRSLADLAAVSKTTVAETLARLEKEGFIGIENNGRRILNPRGLLDRWMVAYETFRPKLLFGRFRTPDPNPEVLEQRIESEMGNSVLWGWGGGVAAMRMTKHFRGEETILHVDEPTHDLARKLRALPAKDGPFIIQRTPAKVAFEGILPRTVHPLLVYAELMATNDPRARETAMGIRERYLKI